MSAAKVAVTPKRKVLVTFGAPKFAIISTSPATVVSFTLSKANRALLVKLRAVKVKVTIAVKDPGGNARTSPKVLTLRAK